MINENSCLIRINSVNRTIVDRKFVFLKYNLFRKLVDQDIYFKALSSHEKGENSKSYFYFAVKKLKTVGLLWENAINFKVAFPYEVEEDKIVLKDGIIYISDSKSLIGFLPLAEPDKCDKCPMRDTCINSLRVISRENEIKVTKEELIEAWRNILWRLRNRIISESLSIIRLDSEN